jgi:hypothetical protein
MPYFVYSVRPFAQLERLAAFESFREASAHAKTLRGGQTAGTGAKIKVIFAENELQAEDLLCQVRDPAPSGDE